MNAIELHDIQEQTPPSALPIDTGEIRVDTNKTAMDTSKTQTDTNEMQNHPRQIRVDVQEQRFDTGETPNYSHQDYIRLPKPKNETHTHFVISTLTHVPDTGLPSVE